MKDIFSMKKIVAVVAAASLCLMLSGCAQPKNLCGVEFKPYGIFSSSDNNPNVNYDVSGWSVFWSIIWSETIVVPVVILGFDLYEPVSVKGNGNIPGSTTNTIGDCSKLAHV
jgi:hypothetical protein